MKKIIIICFKYLLILISLFTFLFLSNLIFHIVPLLKTTSNKYHLNNLINIFAVPSFYHSFFNTLIISTFLYGVTIFNYQKKLRFIFFYLPIITVTFLTFIILSNYNPKQNDLTYNRINDARIYFLENIFHKENETVFYFDQIEKNKINKVIMINKNNISFHNNCNVIFLTDKIQLQLIHPNGKLEIKEFNRNNLINYNIIKNTSINNNFLYLFNNFSGKLLYSQNINYITLLLFCIAFLVISFTSTVKISNYPLLSLMFNIFSMIIFYYIFVSFFDKFNKIFSQKFSASAYKNIIISLIIFSIGIFFQIINMLFKKTHEWEIE